MELLPNPLEVSGVRLLKPRVFGDDRGYFFESFNEAVFSEKIGSIHFRQDNQSQSRRAVLRGLHYQLAPYAQTKLVRVVRGAVWDVAVDLRRSSPTFKKWFGVELTEQNQLQLLVPQGFGHGFVSLTDDAVVAYKVDALYSQAHDRGIRFDDPTLKVDWPLSEGLILSSKDRSLPELSDAEIFD